LLGRLVRERGSRRHDLEARRSLLVLDAAAWRQPGLARTVTQLPPPGTTAPPVPVRATRRTHPARLHTLTGQMTAVAAVSGPGGPLAVTAGDDRAVIVWNPVTGRLIRRCLLPHRAQAVVIHGTSFPVAYGAEVACMELPPAATPGR